MPDVTAIFAAFFHFMQMQGATSYFGTGLKTEKAYRCPRFFIRLDAVFLLPKLSGSSGRELHALSDKTAIAVI